MLSGFSTHTFFPKDSVLKLLLLTDNNNLKARPLPFASIHIPINFLFRGVNFLGMFSNLTVVKNETTVPGFKDGVKMCVGWAIELDTICMMSDYKKWDIVTMVFDSTGLLDFTPLPDHFYLKDKKLWKKSIKLFSNLFFNIVDFLNNPDVVYHLHKHDEKTQEKRIASGKPRISPNILIKITGKTARYLDAVEHLGHREFSHAFWVRGHYRHLVSDKWIYKKGATIWIPPFIKGDKELIKKAYDVGGL